TIRFGPDGMLWIGFGDGGHDGTAAGASTQDPEGHGQNPRTLQGTVVRIDVDAAIPFAIPPNNPFVADGRGAPEVWAYGLRNPWSLWFDSTRVYIGEVGFDRWEEINVLDLESQAGANLGWSVLEGPDCLRSPDCERAGMTPPTLALPRSPGTCAIVLGPPYRGVAMPELTGNLVYVDLCGAWLRTVSTRELAAGTSGVTWLESFASQPTLTAFFEGPHAEWHLLTIDGMVYRLDPVR
ncbi:MAG TPA: PQQ-dependent sugar dehydrogenase, partial [Acidimicrobiia bacterium]|nr:PQQ-dependent sugar dehydrogenase [Acidimicrobiia bacterium]